MTEYDEIISAEELLPKLEGEQIKKEDLEDKEIVVNIEDLVLVEDDGKTAYCIFQFWMDKKLKTPYTSTVGGVPLKKFLSGKEKGYKKVRGKLIKTDRINKKKGETQFYWDFV